MKRLFLVGGSGQLGSEIRRLWDDWEVVAPAHADLDLENADALREALGGAAPSVVINCAAFHNVDRCEAEPERAFAINAVAVDRLARLCAERGTPFVTISTDYVFAGDATRPYTERSRPAPISAYGTSKYAGELLVTRLQGPHLIVRTCGVYGLRPSASKGHTFVDRVIRQARAGEAIRVVEDVVASPTFAGNLAWALRRLVEAGARGLYHAVDEGAVSWYDFAREAIRQAGAPLDTLEAIRAADWKAAARRPAYSALANVRLNSLGIAMPTWQEGIASYLEMAGQCS